MKPRIKLDSTTTSEGKTLELLQHDRDYLLTLDGDLLMSSRVRRSEGELAELGLADAPSGAAVLIGGLGMGFTLRATLDLLDDDAKVSQVELVEPIVRWNREILGALTSNPLEDARTKIIIEDVGAVIRARKNAWDAILLDVDNGPSAMVSSENARLYSVRGVEASHAALKPGGRLVLWSADDDPRFRRRMEDAGFAVTKRRIKSRQGGPQHVIILGIK